MTTTAADNTAAPILAIDLGRYKMVASLYGQGILRMIDFCQA
jgi:hypothetical protein